MEIKSRKGSNTSLKDIDTALNGDSIETKKITLTPRVAQDDVNVNTTTSPISQIGKEVSLSIAVVVVGNGIC